MLILCVHKATVINYKIFCPTEPIDQYKIWEHMVVKLQVHGSKIQHVCGSQVQQKIEAIYTIKLQIQQTCLLAHCFVLDYFKV